MRFRCLITGIQVFLKPNARVKMVQTFFFSGVILCNFTLTLWQVPYFKVAVFLPVFIYLEFTGEVILEAPE